MVQFLSFYLQGPYDAGLNLFGKNKAIIQSILVLADSNDSFQEKLAVETMFFSSNRKEGFFPEAIHKFKSLIDSKNLAIKARALAGTCRYVAYKLINDEDESALAKSCRSIICSNSDIDCKKWACEGLVSATVSASVRDALTDDKESIKALKDLSKVNFFFFFVNFIILTPF